MQQGPTAALILGILNEAKAQGHAPMLRTVLHKLVYLADLYSAEETHGKTYTGEEWRFLHFGPFSNAVARTMDELASSKQLFAEARARDDDSEFVLYSPMGSHGPALRDIGLPGAVALRIDSDLKRYSKNLSALLDYVYFRTAPMEQATPGSTLDFKSCEKISSAAFRAIQMLPISPKALKATRAKLQQILAGQAATASTKPIGPFDDAYERAMSALDGESLRTGLRGIARIK
jgi:hypothetical protein